MAEIVLYDIPTKDAKPTGWTPNPWKARMSLNFKGVSYKTNFIQYPQIAPTLKALAIEPNKEGAEYTCPAVQFPDGVAVMESLAIAKELDRRYPDPPLHTSSDIVPKVASAYMQSSADYFNRTREVRFGMPLSAYREQRGGQKVFDAAKEPVKVLADLLKSDPSGPFFLGTTPSFADFIVASFLKFLSLLNKSEFEQFLAFDPAFGQLFQACEKWLQRDD